MIWTVALLAALLLHLAGHRRCSPMGRHVGTIVTSPQEFDAFVAAHPESFAATTTGTDRHLSAVVRVSQHQQRRDSRLRLANVWAGDPGSRHAGRRSPGGGARGLPGRRGLAVEEEDGTEQIGWYFSGTFRQNFDYRLYPFDRQDIWLRIWSPEPAEGVMPVPDFDAYRDLTPSTLPGIDTQFVYGGWDPLSSAFSYDLIDYNVDFGLGYGFTGAPDPELYFNLSVARDFLGPMLEHLVLEGAIAILLFFLLLLMAHDGDLQDRIGLTIFDLIVASAVSSSPSFSITTPSASSNRRI